MRPDDFAPTRMFRIAGRFRDYGGSALLLKLCLSWIDMWRSGQTPHGRPPLDPLAFATGGHFPVVV
eukprot:8082065-Alexandrium_andersonii.AAC.1